MKTSGLPFLALFLALCASCGGAAPDDETGGDELSSVRKTHCTNDAQCRRGQICGPGQVCISGSPDAGPPPTTDAGPPPGNDAGPPPTTDAGPPPAPDAGSPPPGGCTSMDQCGGGQLCESGACIAMACQNRAPGKTGMRATVQITRYQGLIHGRNGDHEVAFGNITAIAWVHDPGTVDTHSVQLAMNVASSIDPAGLPHEIALAVGQSVELEGEYISGAGAGSSGTAVLHFTHSTCGYVTIAGTTYQ